MADFFKPDPDYTGPVAEPSELESAALSRKGLYFEIAFRAYKHPSGQITFDAKPELLPDWTLGDLAHLLECYAFALRNKELG